MPAHPTLRRAANLLKSDGTPAHDELAFDSPKRTNTMPVARRRLSNSIRRTVNTVSQRLNRSRTAPNVHSHEDHQPELETEARHTRSPSSVLLSPPPPSPTASPSRKRSKRLSLQARMESIARTLAGAGKSDAATLDTKIPNLLQTGTPMTKVSSKRQKKYLFQLDADQGQISYESNRRKFIPIESIKEMRFGSEARYYVRQFGVDESCEDRWITIFYIVDGDYKDLHLIAPTHDLYNIWQVTLTQLYSIRKELMSGLGNFEMRQALWEKHYWKGADLQPDQKLTFDEIEKLCRRLNMNQPKQDILNLFKQADVGNKDYLLFDDFKTFVRLMKARPEVDRLYRKLRAHTNDEFTFDTFRLFMIEKQKMDLQDSVLHAIFERYTPVPKSDQPGPAPPAANQVTQTARVMTLDNFLSFLLSPDNSVLVDETKGVHHDMTQPLSEYYISSSHNTYLSGHQLVGDSTIEGYIRALLHGCRTVEMDIYDGDHEPMIFHGKTLTSKVQVREVCEVIKKYGFIASPYPIIISAEIHCCVAQQELLVEIMSGVFGDTLVRAPIEDRPVLEKLPSPEELKGKVLFKTKNLLLLETARTADAEIIATDSPSSSTSSDSDFIEDFKQQPTEAIKNELKSVMSRVRSVRRKSGSGAPKNKPEKEKIKVKMSLSLIALLVYTVGVKCRGINKKETYAVEHMFSLSENMVNKMMKTAMTDLIKHTRTHLVRIYPKGLRLGSSNYEPHRFWSAGAQLVALNWQTFDLGNMINHAMFQRNGKCGYVRKPAALCINGTKEMLEKRTEHYLDLNIISAQQLPRPRDSSGKEIVDKSIIDPFVEVSLHVPEWVQPAPSGILNTLKPSGPEQAPASVPATTVVYRTSVVKNNGFNPVWEEKLRIPFTCAGDMKDLIFVRFTVREEGADDNEALAYFCTSLANLQSGYRHLPLCDAQLSQFLFSSLFVRIAVV